MTKSLRDTAQALLANWDTVEWNKLSKRAELMAELRAALVDPTPSSNVGGLAIEDAYGALWLVVTTDKRIHAARKRLLSVLDKEGQKRGIQSAKGQFGPTTTAEILAVDTDAKALLLGAARGMRRIVEEIDGTMNHGTWRDERGMRLKDTPEWVALYNALSATATEGE